jgi:hypothetical protein
VHPFVIACAAASSSEELFAPEGALGAVGLSDLADGFGRGSGVRYYETALLGHAKLPTDPRARRHAAGVAGSRREVRPERHYARCESNDRFCVDARTAPKHAFMRPAARSCGLTGWAAGKYRRQGAYEPNLGSPTARTRRERRRRSR